MAAKTVQIPSVCLPRIYNRFDESYVEQVFVGLFGGTTKNESCIQRIDMVQRQDRNTGDYFNLVFVHFKPEMAITDELTAFIKKIEDGEEVRIMYSHPWFWKVRKNTTKPRTGLRDQGAHGKSSTNIGPRIVFEDEDMQKLRDFQKKMYETPNKPHEKQEKEEVVAIEEV